MNAGVSLKETTRVCKVRVIPSFPAYSLAPAPARIDLTVDFGGLEGLFPP